MTPARRSNGGYTLAEVLMAAALLGVLMGGATRLIGTMNTTETAARHGAVALNLLENAVKLWQLGLSPAEALSVLPNTANNEFLDRSVVADASGNGVSFGTAGTTTLANALGVLENINISVVSEDPQGSSNRTITVTAYRPTSR